MGQPFNYPAAPRPFAPAPPRRRGWGRTIFLTLLLLLLAGSVLINFTLIFGSIGGGGTIQTTFLPGNSNQRIAIIPLEGVIDPTLEARFERYANRATEDGSVKAIVILIDTPGGSVTASDEIYKRIKKLKNEKKVPVVVAMRGMATSGGYYAACASDYIVAERSTLTGNIGVLLPHFNLSKLLDKYGVEENTIVSTGATFKNAGSMFKPQDHDDNVYFQEIADSAFTLFKAVVSDGRKGRLHGKIDDIANGKAYTAQQALDYGLIDEIDDTGYLDAAIQYAAKTANLDKPLAVKYQEMPSFTDFLSSSQYIGSRANKGGISVNVDASALDRLSSPQLMYMYSGAAPSTMR